MQAIWLFTICILGACGCVGSLRPTAQNADELRTRSRLISQNWRFVRQDVAHAEAIDLDDATWQAVDLPHTWNVSDGNSSKYYRGPGWYRKHLVLPSSDARKQVYLRFGAASLVADVYVNETHAGQHRGGFAAFCFDVTKLLHPGDNLIAVRVDNTKVPDVAPLAGDFTIFGGLYRDVELLTLDPLHISPVDDASPGVYIRQTNVSSDSATLDITAKLQNANPDPKNATVGITVRDASGAVVAGSETRCPIAAASDADARARLVLNHPHLWDGTNNPYLYSVTVTLQDGAAVTDSVTQPLGVRTFRIDPRNGFILNGRSYPLRGVDIHQEGIGHGWAATRADQDHNYDLIHELGANAVRMAHYQHFDYEYTLCDRYGIVVWAEVPMVNKIGLTKTLDPQFAAVTKQQLRELIKQNFNHPSIAFWSLFNEVVMSSDDPRWALLHEMNDLAHTLDSSRLTTAAINDAATRPVTRWTDATAFNRYFGWYRRQPANWLQEIDKIDESLNHSTRAAVTQPTTQPVPPLRGFALSEYGAGASVYQHEIDPYQPKTGGPWHPEEYQCLVHEQAYRAIEQRPFLWGTFVWVMFDFSSANRHEGDSAGINDKGLVAFDHMTRKDAFYFYKANWSHDAFVHINEQRYQPHPAGPADIKIYSNCDTVELFVGGRSLGTLKNDYGTFIWPGVSFAGDTLHAVARGTKYGQTFTDEVTWKISKTAATHPGPLSARFPATTHKTKSKPATEPVVITQ